VNSRLYARAGGLSGVSDKTFFGQRYQRTRVPAVITPKDSVTLVPNQRRRGEPRQAPLLIVLGNANGEMPDGGDRW